MKILRHLLLIAGVLAVSFAVYSYAARYAYQTYETEEFDASLAAEPGAARPAAPQGQIGKLEIPRLGISAMVDEGVGRRTLNLAVGHIPSTALPGQPGNIGVAAHRDSLFRNLKDVRRDDVITLTTLEKTYAYRVVSFKVVAPTDLSVLAASADEKILTMVTCYPFYYVGHAPMRFIVRAVEID